MRSLTQEEFLRFFHANQILYFEKHLGCAAAARVRRLVIVGLRLRSLIAWAGAPLRSRAVNSSARAYWRVARHFSAPPEAGI